MPTLVLRAHKRPVFRHIGLVFGPDFRGYDVSDGQADELRRCVRLGLLREKGGAIDTATKPRRTKRR